MTEETPSEWLLEQFDKLPCYHHPATMLDGTEITIIKVDPPRSRSTSARRPMFSLYDDNEGLPCLTSTSSIGLYENVPEPALDIFRRYDYDYDMYEFYTNYGGQEYVWKISRISASKVTENRLKEMAFDNLWRKVHGNNSNDM